jgi:hypothetical protein
MTEAPLLIEDEGVGVDVVSGAEDAEGRILEDLAVAVEARMIISEISRLVMVLIFSSHHIALWKTAGIVGMMALKKRRNCGRLRAVVHHQIDLFLISSSTSLSSRYLRIQTKFQRVENSRANLPIKQDRRRTLLKQILFLSRRKSKRKDPDPCRLLHQGNRPGPRKRWHGWLI